MAQCNKVIRGSQRAKLQPMILFSVCSVPIHNTLCNCDEGSVLLLPLAFFLGMLNLSTLNVSQDDLWVVDISPCLVFYCF